MDLIDLGFWNAPRGGEFDSKRFKDIKQVKAGAHPFSRDVIKKAK